jgi:hypothetical protein
VNQLAYYSRASDNHLLYHSFDPVYQPVYHSLDQFNQQVFQRTAPRASLNQAAYHSHDSVNQTVYNPHASENQPVYQLSTNIYDPLNWTVTGANQPGFSTSGSLWETHNPANDWENSMQHMFLHYSNNDENDCEFKHHL